MFVSQEEAACANLLPPTFYLTAAIDSENKVPKVTRSDPLKKKRVEVHSLEISTDNISPVWQCHYWTGIMPSQKACSKVPEKKSN